MTEPLQVSFVCLANICRSPYAELYARSASDASKASFTSTGTLRVPDVPMDAQMAAELAKRGVDAAGQVSRAIDHSIADADLVLTMSAQIREWVVAEYPDVISRTFTLGQFVEAVETLPADVDDPVAGVFARRLTASADLDVPDPYGLGPDVAATAARQIDDYIDRMVGALGMRYVPRRAQG